MEQIIKLVLNLFESFTWIHWEIDEEFKKIVPWDIEKISFQYFNEVKIIERQLNGLFLTGNDMVLNRIGIELERIKGLLSKIDFGVRISVESNGFKGIKEVVIEPEQLKELNEVKLFYINSLLAFVDKRIPLQSQKSSKGKDLQGPKLTEKKLEDFLTDEGRELLPKLIAKYKNGKPVDLAFMWAAMIQLTTLVCKPISNNSELHRLLTKTFGDIGTIQSFNRQMRELRNNDGALINTNVGAKMDEHISAILALR